MGVERQVEGKPTDRTRWQWVRVLPGVTVSTTERVEYPGAVLQLPPERAQEYVSNGWAELTTEPEPDPGPDRTGWVDVEALREFHERDASYGKGDRCQLPPDRAEWLEQIGSVRQVG